MSEEKKNENVELCQTVWLDFSDGTSAGFLGKAHCFEGDKRTVVGIRFTAPMPLPPGAKFCDEQEMKS